MAKFNPIETKLTNGLPVLFAHYDGPVGSLHWWNSTGSLDEQKGEEGFAHFLEHMLFKDTAAKETGKPSQGKLALAVEGRGGDINAYTSFDQTVYHVSCAADHFEGILKAFGDLAKMRSFLKSDFTSEREVILEELRKNEDSPDRMFFQEIFKSVFPRHPYGRPVIGTVKSLKDATVKTLEGFFNRNYVPDRMGLIVVCPLDAEGKRMKAILKILETSFGKIPNPKNKKVSIRDWSKALKAHHQLVRPREIFAREFSVQSPSLCLAFKAPELGHPDLPALDLLVGTLGNGELGRLYQRLFYKESKVTNASAGVYSPISGGMIHMMADYTNLADTLSIAKSILSEVAEIRKYGVTEEEQQRMIVLTESEKQYSLQSADGIAGRLGFLRFVMEDLNADQVYLAALKEVTVDDLKRVAAEYLSPEKGAWVIMVPKGQLKKVPQTELKSLLKAEPKSVAKKMPVASLKKRDDGKIIPFELDLRDSGMKTAFSKRNVTDTFSIYATLPGGIVLEGSPHGASHFLGMTWSKGTKSRSAQEISKMIEGRAASLSGLSGRNTIALALTGLSRDWDVLSELFSEVLLEANFPDEEVDHSRRVVSDSIRSVEDHSGRLCSKLFLENLYENHPYGRMIQGSGDSIKNIHSSELQKLHRQWISADRMNISVAGNIAETRFTKWIEDIESRIKGSSQTPIGWGSTEQRFKLDAPRWVERSLAREQLHVLVGGFGTTLSSADRYALRLMTAILGGMSGRLFIELREKKSLAYTVSPTSFEGVFPGYIGTYIACAPNKKDTALAGMQTVLEFFAKKGPTAKEIVKAKESYLGSRAMDLQTDASIASYLALELLYKGQAPSEKELKKLIDGVTANQIREVCRQYLIEPHRLTAIVG